MAKTILGIFVGIIIATLLMGLAWCIYAGIIILWNSLKRKPITKLPTEIQRKTIQYLSANVRRIK